MAAKKKKTKKLTMKELKIKEEMRQFRLALNRRMKEVERKRYYSVSQEARQHFIRLMHEGKTFGEAREEVGIDRDVALAVYVKNNKKKTHTYYILNQPEDVK